LKDDFETMMIMIILQL